MQKLDLALYNKEIPEDEIATTKIKVQNLDSLQHSLKIMLNSIYGALGTAHSPIGNNEISQTVTRTGKYANISSSEYIKNCFKKMFGIDDNYVVCCSGDTDTTAASTKIWIKK